MSLALVWETSALLHAARADRLDVLGDIARGSRDQPWHNCTTHAARQELEHKGVSIGVDSWLGAPVHVDGLDEVVALARWVERIGAGSHHRGEATVLAYADAHDAVVIMDDDKARRVAERYGLVVHGSLWVMCEAVKGGRLALAAASSLADVLIADGARYPFEPGGLPRWARGRKLLDAV